MGVAGPTGATGPQGPPAATLFAAVLPNGTLSTGTLGTTSQRIDVGQYIVTFPQSASFCARLLSVGADPGVVEPVNTLALGPPAFTSSAIVDHPKAIRWAS